MRYVPETVASDQMLAVVEKLGYRPSVVGDFGLGDAATPNCAPLPEPIASALETARGANKPLFIDFFAEWCVPCHVLEDEVLPDPAVVSALESFHFLRVDTDESPAAGQCLHVFGLPTLVVLDGEGAETFRHEGLLEPEELAAGLWQARTKTEETHR